MNEIKKEYVELSNIIEGWRESLPKLEAHNLDELDEVITVIYNLKCEVAEMSAIHSREIKVLVELLTSVERQYFEIVDFRNNDESFDEINIVLKELIKEFNESFERMIKIMSLESAKIDERLEKTLEISSVANKKV